MTRTSQGLVSAVVLAAAAAAAPARAATMTFTPPSQWCGTASAGSYVGHNWAEANEDGKNGFFAFATAALPDNATVTGVTLSAYMTSSGSSGYVKLHASAFAPPLWTGDYAAPKTYLTNIPWAWHNWASVSVPASVVSTTSHTGFAISLAGGGYLRYECWNANAVKLTVTYTTAVCGNSVVEPTEQCDGGACCSSACTFMSSTAVCRGAAGACDLAETCTGSSASCPADAIRPGGAVCRASAGSCDVAEVCNGSSTSCPADEYAAAGVVCGPTGVCGNGWCDGTMPTCPPPYKPAGTLCRAAAGDCDVAETCTGTWGDCPADTLVTAGTTCRPSGGGCDPAETCTGSSSGCPIDGKLAAGTTCRAAAGGCDATETCTGSGDQCPADLLKPAGATCRAAAGSCDVAETCAGNTSACPADTKVASGTFCRASEGDCDLADYCNGSSPSCVNAMQSGNVCRAATGPCDKTEVCPGNDDDCPGDAFHVGSVCRGSAGWWDEAEVCGEIPWCPPDGEPLPPPSGLAYVGCFTDSGDRALPVFLGNYGPGLCYWAAQNQGYRYAGVQAGQECWAGDTLGHGQVDDAECSTPCDTNQGLYCGGPWRNSIYDTRVPLGYATVAITLHSRDRWLIAGRDGGHCEKACLDVDTEYSEPVCLEWAEGEYGQPVCVQWQGGCSDYADIDGLYLQPESIVVDSNAPNTAGAWPELDLDYIQGAFQLEAGHWEWPERGIQNGPDPFSYCAGDRVFDYDIHTYLGTDIASATYHNLLHMGAPTQHSSTLDLVWYESDKSLPADYYRWTTDFGPWLSECLARGAGTHEIAEDLAVQNRVYASPSLCDDRGCEHGNYAVKFDVICNVTTSMEPIPVNTRWVDYWGTSLFGGLAYHRYACLSDGEHILTSQTYDGFSNQSYCSAGASWTSPAYDDDVFLDYHETSGKAELDAYKDATHARYGINDSSTSSPYCDYSILCDCNSDCWINDFSWRQGHELDVLSPCWDWCGP